jgi:uncharacterized protein YjdB
VRTIVPFSALTLTPTTLTLPIGAAGQLTASARDSAGTVLTSPAISWSSAAPAIATVSAGGAGDGGCSRAAYVEFTAVMKPILERAWAERSR